MEPGYQGRMNDEEDMNLRHRHDALSGDDFNAGVESDNPEEDKLLRIELMRKLRAHPELDVREVVLNVKGGFVSITGIVDNADMKSTIEALVEKTDGVVDVVNFLQLKRGVDLQH